MRVARGRRTYAVEISDRIVEMMINAGRLTDEQSEDRAYVALEASAMIEERASQLGANFPLRVTLGGRNLR